MPRGAGPHPFRLRLRNDHSLWLELSYCDQHDMNHSTFLSWSKVDRQKALAFALEKSQKCTMCGTAPWEWEKDRRAYQPVEDMCMGCYVKESTSEGAERKPGTTISLIPRAAAEAKAAEQAKFREGEHDQLARK